MPSCQLVRSAADHQCLELIGLGVPASSSLDGLPVGVFLGDLDRISAVWDSTMVRFWFPGGASDQTKVEVWLNDRPEGRILTDKDLKENGCLFPDRRCGELWYLLKQGTIFAPSFMNQRHVPGMHGYDPQDLDSAACWLTNHDHYEAPDRIEKINRVMRQAAQS